MTRAISLPAGAQVTVSSGRHPALTSTEFWRPANPSYAEMLSPPLDCVPSGFVASVESEEVVPRAASNVPSGDCWVLELTPPLWWW